MQITEKDIKKAIEILKKKSIKPTLGVISWENGNWKKPSILEAIKYWLFKHKWNL